MTNHPLLQESVWLDQGKYEDAERIYQESLSKGSSHTSSIVNEIAQARQKIQKALTTPGISNDKIVDSAVHDRLVLIEKENKQLIKDTQDLRSLVSKLESRVASLERAAGGSTTTTTQTTPNKAVEGDDDDDDDNDIDLFGSDDELEEEAEKLKQKRIQEYADKKAKKPALVAKSNIILDVKPWDDETDMAVLEKCVRSIKKDGLLWGTSKLVPVGYGIKKLQIACVVEDDKVGTDDLEEEIEKFEDHIQSMDIVAFNKI